MFQLKICIYYFYCFVISHIDLHFVYPVLIHSHFYIVNKKNIITLQIPSRTKICPNYNICLFIETKSGQCH